MSERQIKNVCRHNGIPKRWWRGFINLYSGGYNAGYADAYRNTFFDLLDNARNFIRCDEMLLAVPSGALDYLFDGTPAEREFERKARAIAGA
jgi:hypothetical protein